MATRLVIGLHDVPARGSGNVGRVSSQTPYPDAAAWHEAGHALIAHALGASVRLVTIESEIEGHEGHSEIAWRGGLSDRERARGSALVSMAGPLAELVFRGDDHLEQPEVLSSWRGDWSEFESCVSVLAATESERDELRRGLLDELRARFAEPATRECLARIADMLGAHGTLDESLFEDCLD